MAEFEIKVGETYRLRDRSRYEKKVVGVTGPFIDTGDSRTVLHERWFHEDYEPIPPAPGLVMTEEEADQLRDYLLIPPASLSRLERIEFMQNIEAIRERTRKEYGQ